MFQMHSVMVCLRKIFNREIQNKKEIQNTIKLQVKSLIQITVNFRTEKITARFYHPPNILFRDMKYCAPNIMYEYS